MKKEIAWSVYIERIRVYFAKHGSMSNINDVADEYSDSNRMYYAKALRVLILNGFYIRDTSVKEYRLIPNPNCSYNIAYIPQLAEFYYKHRNRFDKYVKRNEPEAAADLFMKEFERLNEKDPEACRALIRMCNDMFKNNPEARNYAGKVISRYVSIDDVKRIALLK